MAIKEQFGSREYELNTQGGFGRRVWVCDPAEARACARPLEPFPLAPELKCRSLSVVPYTPNTSDNPYRQADLVKVTATYNVTRNEEDAPVINIDAGGKVLECGLGRTWESTGTKVDVAQGIPFTTLIFNITLTMFEAPLALIQNNINKINHNWFAGCPPETMLFEDASIERKYDWDNQRFKDRVTFRFNYQNCSWNVVWRAPRQATDALGNLVYDSNKDPVYVDGPAGIGGWDRMIPPIYPTTDFGPMLGMPATSMPYNVTSSNGNNAGLGGSAVEAASEEKWRSFLRSR